MILILEDDADRIERFTLALQHIDPALPVRMWRSAHRMLGELPSLLSAAWLLSLDHDLAPDGTEVGPGDGSDVVRWLAGQPPVCPVVVHSANSQRAAWMGETLTAAAWEYHRVPPLGDDWIEQDWRRVVRRTWKRRRR